MGAAESLAAWGILRAGEVVELAAATGLDLASAATLLEIESAGGHNVWGHDVGDTGGAYVKGAEVTRAAYEQYKRLRLAGRIKAQGVGPCQLTYPGYQEQADALGGCWDWRANVRVGFGVLLAHHRAYGIRSGFRRYNGSGPAAEAYADKAMQRRAKWLLRLGDQAGAVPAPPASTSTKDDDMPWTAAEGAPQVPDFYAGEGKTLPDPLTALAWVTTHAARARDEAATARTVAAAAMGELAAQGRVTAELKAEIVALKDAVANQAAPAGAPADARAFAEQVLGHLSELLARPRG